MGIKQQIKSKVTADKERGKNRSFVVNLNVKMKYYYTKIQGF